jgi:hypothetical protein
MIAQWQSARQDDSICNGERLLVNHHPPTRKGRFWRLFWIAFLLNVIWETAQLPAFEGMEQIPFWGHLIGGGIATLFDALFICGVYLVLQRARRSPPATYLLAAALGSITAIIVEHLALAGGWWSYSDVMPVLPFLGTGLFPFLQLTVLTPLSLRLTK